MSNADICTEHGLYNCDECQSLRLVRIADHRRQVTDKDLRQAVQQAAR